jgi:succinate dehydrogenase / fumarate reductase iron-sulfur subunit
MSQIMRLRRKAGSDFDIEDRNNGLRHEHAFVNNIRKNGILHEPDLLADSYGGKLNPNAGRELLSGLPTAIKGLMRGKMTPKTALLHTHKAPKEVKRIFDTVEGRSERVELNLYVTGYEDAPEEQAAREEESDRETTGAGGEQGQPEAKGAGDREPPTESSAPGEETESEGS